MATIWQRHATARKRHRNEPLPEILPVVLYHGEERWDAPLQFVELIANGPDSPHVPHYRPVFVDLAELPDEQITGSLRAVLGLVALKYSRLRLEQSAMDLLTELLHLGQGDPAVRHLVRVVHRIYAQVKDTGEVDGLVAAASRLGYHEVEDGYMTFAQDMLEKGSMQCSREVLARQLDRKFGLTDAERERILSCDDRDSLDAALDEIITADEKASVLNTLP